MDTKNYTYLDDRPIAQQLLDVDFDSGVDAEFARKLLAESPFLVRRGVKEHDIVGLFHANALNDELRNLREHLIEDHLSGNRKAEFSKSMENETAETPVSTNVPDIGIDNLTISKEELRSHSGRLSLMNAEVRCGDKKYGALIEKIMNDENLLRFFLLPWKSKLCISIIYKLGLELSGEQETAKGLVRTMFMDTGYTYFGEFLSGDEKDSSLYVVLQKYAIEYFRTKNATKSLNKVKDIVRPIFPQINEMSILFSFSQRDSLKDLLDGMGGNNGFMVRGSKDGFHLNITHGNKLSPDDARNRAGENHRYSGIEFDFATLLHECLHGLLDTIVDPEFVSGTLTSDQKYKSFYAVLSEGFATFGEMLVLRNIVENKTHMGLGEKAHVNVFETILEGRRAFLETSIFTNYRHGVQILNYIFMRDGERAIETIRNLDVRKLFEMKVDSPLYLAAISDGKMEDLLKAVSK